MHASGPFSIHQKKAHELRQQFRGQKPKKDFYMQKNQYSKNSQSARCQMRLILNGRPCTIFAQSMQELVALLRGLCPSGRLSDLVHN